jgi:hypothetical protein
VEQIAAVMKRYPFQRLYGAFNGLNVLDEPDAIERSARRYAEHVRGV